MIETPAAGDPRTPIRLALRLAWCQSADPALVCDSFDVLLPPSTEKLDELAAAEAMLSWRQPVRMTVSVTDRILTVRAAAVGSEERRDRPVPVLPPEQIDDVNERTILAWTAGRGLLVSYAELLAADAGFVRDSPGFMAAWRREGMDKTMIEILGLDEVPMPEIRHVLVAGRSGGIPLA